MEIDKTLFNAFNEFELDDLSFFNEVDRHYEQSEVTEATLNKRAMKPQEPIEETFDGSNAVASCRTAMYFMTAASCQPPYFPALPRHSFQGAVTRLQSEFPKIQTGGKGKWQTAIRKALTLGPSAGGIRTTLTRSSQLHRAS